MTIQERSIEIDGHRLTVGADSEPRMRDLDIAAWLEFERPAKVRDIIRRHVTAGRLSPFAVLTTVGKTGGRPAREYWLTEAETLFIATQSETPKALAVTQDMIRVFMLARRGALQAPASNDTALAAVLVQVTQMLTASNTRLTLLDGKIEAIATRIDRESHPHGMIDKGAAREILDEMKAIASEEYDRKAQPREWRSARGKVDSAVRGAASLASSVKWDALDIACRSRAWQKLGAMRTEAKARAANRAEVKARLQQTTLFDALPASIRALGGN